MKFPDIKKSSLNILLSIENSKVAYIEEELYETTKSAVLLIETSYSIMKSFKTLKILEEAFAIL